MRPTHQYTQVNHFLITVDMFILNKGPFIIVSGHDLKDLEMLLEQTEGDGHSTSTPMERCCPDTVTRDCGKYPHLIGNFGGAWQDQQKQFDHLPGCILMTTNCLMRPRSSYKDRIYTAPMSSAGTGVRYIPKGANGDKGLQRDHTSTLWNWAVFREDQEVQEILVGFGHHAVLERAEEIISCRQVR